jgi:carbon-monoxide dehydrogenase large subunit
VSSATDVHEPRLERISAGRGRFLADIPCADARHAAFVRAPVAHARLLGVNAEAALRLPGVDFVATQRDLYALGGRGLPIGWVVPGQRASARELLAGERVRFAGEPVALVVAESRELAEAACELVELELEPLPVVVDALTALEPGAPLIYPDWGDNVLARHDVEAGDAGAAFEAAEFIVRERFEFGRQSASPMEPRGALARHDASEDLVILVSSSQSPHHSAETLAVGLSRPAESVRVIVPDVGGSFGSKDHASVEEAAICLAAIALGRPIRWLESRTEHLLAGVHSREQRYDLELAARRDGRVLGVRGRLVLDAGAAGGNHGIGTAIYSATVLPGPYDFKHYRLETLGVVTNKSPSAAYRGYGAPEAAFAMEGLMDRLADACGLDPADVRRRNLIAPEAMPYRSATGCVYDPADHPRALAMALDLADYERAAAERERPDGRRRGAGIACFVLMGGFGPSKEAIAAGMAFRGDESARVRLDVGGQATVMIGMPTQGQGIDTAVAQVCARELGLASVEEVRVVSDDTAATPYSPVGAISSRGAAVGGSAVALASRAVAGRVREAAADRLGVAPADVLLAGSAAHAGERSVAFADLISAALEAERTVDPSAETFSYAAHVAVVDVDPATGAVEVVRYVAVSDCGTLIDPKIVRGQVEGGVAQGIGGALMEELRFDEDGRPLSATLFDYSLPTAADVPDVEVAFLETPTDRTVTGARGAGEIGIIGPAAAIAGAVAQALGNGARPRSVPLTPERVRALAAEAEPVRASGGSA